MGVLTEQRRASGIKDMDILEQEIWNELQMNNRFMDLIMNKRWNQVIVNLLLMENRVHCHFSKQDGKGPMNSLVLLTVVYLERLRQLVEQNTS